MLSTGHSVRSLKPFPFFSLRRSQAYFRAIFLCIFLLLFWLNLPLLARLEKRIVRDDYTTVLPDPAWNHIIDALESVSTQLRETNSDFDLWRRLKQFGRAVLRPDELSGKAVWVDQGTGKAKNPGW